MFEGVSSNFSAQLSSAHAGYPLPSPSFLTTHPPIFPGGVWIASANKVLCDIGWFDLGNFTSLLTVTEVSGTGRVVLEAMQVNGPEKVGR